MPTHYLDSEAINGRPLASAAYSPVENALSIQARDRLILALDVPHDPENPDRLIEPVDAQHIVAQLGDIVPFIKIGWPLYMAGGDASDLRKDGLNIATSDYVAHKTARAIEAGCDGVITSGQEVADIRKTAPPGFLIVTPGIRPSGAPHNDHKRAVTPAASILAGSDFLVIGRPITTAPNPRQAALDILAEMQAAFDQRESIKTS